MMYGVFGVGREGEIYASLITIDKKGKAIL
jgi:hypothetical protein